MDYKTTKLTNRLQKTTKHWTDYKVNRLQKTTKHWTEYKVS